MGFNIEYNLTMVFYKMLMLHNYPLYINKGANCQRCAATFHIFTCGITPLPPLPRRVGPPNQFDTIGQFAKAFLPSWIHILTNGVISVPISLHVTGSSKDSCNCYQMVKLPPLLDEWMQNTVCVCNATFKLDFGSHSRWGKQMIRGFGCHCAL